MREFIILEDVSKSFNKNCIFENIGCSFNEGESVAIMGKNGCGKSTLLKIIAGLLSCSKGKVITKQDIRISYIPDKLPRLPFKVEDYLIHMGRIQGLLKKEIEAFINAKFEYFDIDPSIKKQLINNCSKGTMQKINLLQAILVKPDLLVMDEPFSGLDEKTQLKLIYLLKEMMCQNVTFIITCHDTALAKELTENIYILDNQLCPVYNDHSDYFIVKFMETRLTDIADLNIDGLRNLSKENDLFSSEVKKGDVESVLIHLFNTGFKIHSVNLKQFT